MLSIFVLQIYRWNDNIIDYINEVKMEILIIFTTKASFLDLSDVFKSVIDYLFAIDDWLFSCFVMVNGSYINCLKYMLEL